MRAFFSLLYKDFLISRATFIGLAIFMALFPLFTVFVLGGTGGYSTISVMFPILIFGTIMRVDYTNKWEQSLFATPVSDKVLVFVRYFEILFIFGLIYGYQLYEKAFTIRYLDLDSLTLDSMFNSEFQWMFIGFTLLCVCVECATVLILGVKRGWYMGIGLMVGVIFLFWIIGMSISNVNMGFGDEVALGFMSVIRYGSLIAVVVSFILSLIFVNKREA